MLKIFFFLALAMVAETAFSSNLACKMLLEQTKITFQVPFNAGGSFDLLARAIAIPLSDAIKKRVSIQNNPSLGGLSSLNSVLQSNNKNVNLGFFTGRALIDIANNNKIDWRNRITPLATYLSEETIWLTRKKTPADILSVPVITIAGSNSDEFEAKSISKLLGKPYRLISGYTGSSDYANAVLRGEVDFFSPTRGTAERFLKSGEYIPSLILSANVIENFPQAHYLAGTQSILKKLPSPKITRENAIKLATEITKISRSDRMIFSSSEINQDINLCIEMEIIKAIESSDFKNKAQALHLSTISEKSKLSKIRLIEIEKSLNLLNKFLYD